ncbi:hypothetical protein [Poseidonibacter sp.]|uniref:hypothetical protein n=1 Tax=Poseidonibacter sp. TaxID=2321188 RepID=UPI003C7590A8
MKLEISLFKFDCNSDYLPYYTKHFLKINDEKTLLDILNTINKDAKLGYENDENFDLVVNGVYVKASISINDLVKNFKKELTIEPISIRRANNDLIIDDNDFIEKLELLKDFTTQEDIEKYKTLKAYFYASNTLNYKSDYIGDALLLLAFDLIQKDISNEKSILNIINEYEIGAQYHTSLKNRILDLDEEVERKITNIQDKLQLRASVSKQNFRVNNTLIIDFGELEESNEIKHDFKDFNIVYYPSLNIEKTQTLLSKLNANILNLDTTKLDLAKNTFAVNPDITFQIATTIILDAFDNNADFLLVDNTNDFYLFDYNRKALEKCSGREIILPVIHVNELEKLASGKHDEARKTLNLHQVNPEII